MNKQDTYSSTQSCCDPSLHSNHVIRAVVFVIYWGGFLSLNLHHILEVTKNMNEETSEDNGSAGTLFRDLGASDQQRTSWKPGEKQ